MDMKQAMKERHMVRKYTDEPIPEDIVEKLNRRVRENNAVSYTHLTLPTTPYV